MEPVRLHRHRSGDTLKKSLHCQVRAVQRPQIYTCDNTDLSQAGISESLRNQGVRVTAGEEVTQHATSAERKSRKVEEKR